MWWLLKILGFFVAILGLPFVISLLLTLGKEKALPRDPTTGRLNIRVNPWLFTLAILGVSLLMIQYVDRRPLMSLGLHFYSSWWIELALGILIGSVMLILMAAMLWGLTKRNPFGTLTLAKFATIFGHLQGAVGEELAVRGYPLQVLIGAISLYPAVLATSAFFGFLHYQGQGWIGAASTGLAGLLLATAVLKTKALWLAVGIHFGWNFMEALFGLGEVTSKERYLAENCYSRHLALADGAADPPAPRDGKALARVYCTALDLITCQ